MLQCGWYRGYTSVRPETYYDVSRDFFMSVITLQGFRTLKEFALDWQIQYLK